MIEIRDLNVSAGEKHILKWVSVNFELWKNYCLLWTNWSGKSTLSSALMWSPKYSITWWTVTLEWKDINKMSPEERSKKGLFLSFQNVPEIPWIRLWEYLRTIYNVHLKESNPETRSLSPFVFKRFVKKHLEALHIEEIFLDRELNVWFSWWEKRKIEILQMKLISPKYIILDEIDSWLDLDAFRKVAELLKSLSSEENSLIIITHYFKILEYIDVDEVMVMKGWKIVRTGGPELAQNISQNGFES
jgi:Fe-S cluster assembly ATP-binding protein